MNYAIFSTTRDSCYSFHAPIVSRLWSSFGFTPIVVLTNWGESAIERLVLDEVILSGARVVLLPPQDGYLDSTAAQCARSCCSSLDFICDDDYVITADVDMWPTSGTFYKEYGKAIDVYFSNAYAHESIPHFPMCYIGMKKRIWRDVAGAHESLHSHVKMILDDGLGAGADHWKAWNHDELWLSRKIASSSYWREGIYFGVRPLSDGGMCADRIDRARQNNPPISHTVDFHAWRPSYTDKWSETYSIFAQLLPSQSGWLCEYKERFLF